MWHLVLACLRTATVFDVDASPLGSRWTFPLDFLRARWSDCPTPTCARAAWASVGEAAIVSGLDVFPVTPLAGGCPRAQRAVDPAGDRDLSPPHPVAVRRRSCGRSRATTRSSCTRNRLGWRPQSPLGRTARRRKDDDGPARAWNPATAHVRRGAQRHSRAFGRRSAAPGNRSLPIARSGRRTTSSRTWHWWAADRSRGPARSAWRTTACCFWTRCSSSIATSSRCWVNHPRRVTWRSPGRRAEIFPARFMLVGAINPVPLRVSR